MRTKAKGSARPSGGGKSKAKSKFVKGRLQLKAKCFCGVCRQRHGSVVWAEDAEQNDEKDEIENRCAECSELCQELSDKPWCGFCEDYEENEDTRSRVEKARQVKRGRATAECEDGSLLKVKRFGIRMARDVLAKTKAQLKSELPEDIDVEKVKVPCIDVPRLDGGSEKNYLFEDPLSQGTRMTVFVEFTDESSTTTLKPDDVLIEGHLENRLRKAAAERARLPEFQGLFGKLVSFESLAESSSGIRKSGGGRHGAIGRPKPLAAAVGGLTETSPQALAQVVAAAEDDAHACDEAGSTCDAMPADSLAHSFNEASVGEMKCLQHGSVKQERGRSSSPAQSTAKSECNERSRSPMAKTQPKAEGVVSASSGLRSSPVSDGKGTVMTEEIRKMTPHQKSDYWASKVDYDLVLVDRQDRRFVRQGSDLVARHRGTTDPSLKSKLDTLTVKLGNAAVLERLSPSNIEGEEQRAIVEAIDLALHLEMALPHSVQLSLLKVRLRDYSRRGSWPLDVMKIVACWHVEPIAEGCTSTKFDPKLPTVSTLQVDDTTKVETFRDYFCYSIIEPLIKLGPSRRPDFYKWVMALLQFVEESAEDAEVSDCVAACVFDTIVALRGLAALLSKSVGPSSTSQVFVSAVSSLRKDSTNKVRPLCCKVSLLIAVDQGYTGALLKEFLKYESALPQIEDDLKEAFNDFLGNTVVAPGTRPCQVALLGVVENIAQWECSLRPGSCDELVDKVSNILAEHITKSLEALSSDAGNGDLVRCAELSSLLAKASAQWPLSQELPDLSSQVRARASHFSSEEVAKMLAERCSKALATLKAMPTKDFDFEASVVDLVGQSIDVGVSHALKQLPSQVELLLLEVMRKLNTSAAWATSADISVLVSLAEQLLKVFEFDANAKQYHTSCLRVLVAGHELSRTSASLKGEHTLLVANRDRKFPEAHVHGVQRALKVLTEAMPSCLELPKRVGDLTHVAKRKGEAEELLVEFEKLVTNNAVTNLMVAMEELDKVCHGPREGEAWDEEWKACTSQEAKDKAWDKAVKLLLSVKISVIDDKKNQVQQARAALALAMEPFSKTEQDHPEMTEQTITALETMLHKAAMTKIEGTIMYISKSVTDPVTLRNKMVVQKRLAKKEEEHDGQTSNIMNEKVRQIMLDALKFK